MMSSSFNQTEFSAAVEAMPDDGLSIFRQAAARQFGNSGFPTQRDEDWKYTNLSSAAELSNRWLQKDSATEPAQLEWSDITDIQNSMDANWIIIRNGNIDVSAIAASAGLWGSGITVVPLTAGIAQLNTDDPLSAFNAALLKDGIRIHARPDCNTDKPIGLLFADDGNELVSQSRVVIDCGANSALQVVEYAISRGAEQFANAVIEVKLQNGANLDYVRLQKRHAAHIGINRLAATLDTAARLRHCAFDFGNGMGRNDVAVDLRGSNADAKLSGLYLTEGQQHIDNHLSATHSAESASSTQNYRGILGGRSRGVFNGKAIVQAGADGTDANQSNHNLLLSERSEVDTKPELEIYADDVKCSHGATVGQLDESAIFYLQTRGIERREATRMLVRAFAASILDDIPISECESVMTDALSARLDQLSADED